MAKAILIPTLVAAKNVDTYNASFVHTADLDNGSVFQKGALSTDAGKSEVYTLTAPATGTGLTNLWMAFSPEDVITTDAAGNQYKIGQLNPQSFTNVAGLVFSGFKIQVGDKVLVSADGISGTAAAYAVAANGATKLAFSATVITGVTFAVTEVSYISVATGTPSQRVTAYQLECISIA